MMFRKTLITVLCSFIPLVSRGDDKNEKAPKVGAKIKTIFFEEFVPNIYYLEGKEYKPIDISNNTISPEKTYAGKEVIEFFKAVIEEPTTEIDLAKRKLDEAKTSEAKIGIEYNKLLEEMVSYAQSLPDPDSPNYPSRNRLSEYQSRLDELKQKLDQASHSTYLETQKMYAKDKEEREAVYTSNTKTKSPVELPKPKYEPLAKFTIPASGGNYILIFTKTPNGVTISPLNDAPGVFPFGSYQFINLTGTTVELRFGSKVIPLSPNGRTVFKPETANGEYLEGEFWTKEDDEFKLGYKFRNLHISRIRTLAFIMPTAPGQSALNLKIAEERGQIEPPAPPENPKDKGKKNKEAEKKEPENRPFG
jgi:hypothetical protein